MPLSQLGLVISLMVLSSTSEAFSKQQQEPTDSLKWKLINPLPSTSAGVDVHFIDDQKGFVVTDRELLVTVDGGDSWHPKINVKGGRSIAFAGIIGYLVGDNGLILKTNNGGSTWSKAALVTSDGLRCVNMLTKDTIMVISGSSAQGGNNLYTSRNGGNSWQKRELPIYSVTTSFFINSNVGFIENESGSIFKTINGGITWKQVVIPVTDPFYPVEIQRIQFVTKQIGYATRQGSLIMKTIDGGETWNSVEADFNSPSFHGLHFIDENRGFISGVFHQIKMTVDGGKTWSSISHQEKPSGAVNDVYFLNQNLGFAISTTKEILRTTNGGANWEGYGRTYGDINAGSFSSSSTLYLLSSNNKNVIKLTDGGAQIQSLAIGINEPVEAFDFVTDSVGYASAFPRHLLKTTDGGNSWNQIPSFNWRATAMQFLNKEVGFATLDQYISKTMDGGRTWDLISEVGGRGKKLQFVSASTGFLMTGGYEEPSLLYKTSDGGATWNVMSHGFGLQIIDLNFVNENLGFVLSEASWEQRLFTTLDGGASWNRIPMPPGSLSAVNFFSPRFGYVISDGQTFLTRNGGITWDIDDPSVQDVTLLHAHGDVIYATGNSGTIYRTTITRQHLVKLSLNLQSVTQSSAVFKIEVESSIDLPKEALVLEIWDKSGYREQITLDSVSGLTSISLIRNVTGLKKSTEYFARLKLIGSYPVTGTETPFKTTGDLIDEQTVRLSVELESITDSSAVLKTDVVSSIDMPTQTLVLEVWDQSGYNERITLDSVSSFASLSLSRKIVGLKKSTDYFASLQLHGSFPVNGTKTPFRTTGDPGTTDDPITVGLNEDVPKVDSFHAYPNPTKDFIFISRTNATPFTIELRDLYGRVIMKGFEGSDVPVDLSGLAPGLYMMLVETTGGQQVVRVVKK